MGLLSNTEFILNSVFNDNFLILRFHYNTKTSLGQKLGYIFTVIYMLNEVFYVFYNIIWGGICFSEVPDCT